MRASPNPPNNQLALHAANGENVAAYPNQHGHDCARQFRLLSH